MNEIEKLQKELDEWNAKYSEAESDRLDAEERLDEAEYQCSRLERLIEKAKEVENAKTIGLITQKLSGQLDFRSALLKASLFVSRDPHMQSLGYIAITDKQVIALDGYKGYVATVEVPAENQNTFIKVKDHMDILAELQGFQKAYFCKAERV